MAIVEVSWKPGELEELDRCEGIIERWINSVMEGPSALLTIHDLRLYRHYGTFERYCLDRWGFTARRAYQSMDAVEVIGNLNRGSQTLPILPSSERQVRPLVKLDPDRQVEAWSLAVSSAPDGKVTSKHVERVVREMIGSGPRAVSDVSDVSDVSVSDVSDVSDEPGVDDPDRDGCDLFSDRPVMDGSGSLDAFPVRSKLSGQARAIFDSDVGLFLAARERMGRLFDDMKELLKKHDRRGAYHQDLSRAISARNPAHWVACPDERFGGCDGTGLRGGIKCPACHGRGYLRHSIPSQKQMAYLRDKGVADVARLNPGEASRLIGQFIGGGR